MSIRLATLRLFLFAFVAFFWLSPQNPGNDQVVTRTALAIALAEGSASIDRFADLTIDKALVDGHYYADKVPGHSFLAVPAVAVLRALLPGDPIDARIFSRYAQAATITVNCLLSAIAVAIFFHLAMLLGAPPASAFFGTFALALATPFFGWSTAFFAHSVTGSFSVFAFALIAWANLRDGRLARAPLFYGAALGIILGYELTTDLTAAPVVVAAASLAVALAARKSMRHAIGTGLGGLVGGLVGLLPLAIYNAVVFGSPFKLGYSSVVGFEGMQQGFFGLTTPSIAVAVEVLFGLYRGLLPLSPILLVVPFGLWAMWKLGPVTRIAAAVVTFAFLAQLGINASYFYWDGGWSTGPRHLVPILPFLALPLAFAWPRTRLWQGVVLVLFGLSLAISLICAATDMFSRSGYRVPFIEYLLPMLWQQPEKALRALPMLIVWGIFFFVWTRLARSDAATSAATP